MFARWLAFVVWAAVAGSAVFWGLKLFVRPMAVPSQAVVATQGAVAVADLSRLFGVEAQAPVAEAPPPPPESSRFQLIGLMAGRAAAAHSQGVALIAVDGKTPRAYRVGAAIDGALVLQSVHARKVAIGPRGGAALVSLELPLLPPPATGVPGGVAPAVPGGAVVVPLPPPGFAPGSVVPVPPNPMLDRLRGVRQNNVPSFSPSGGITPMQPDGQQPVEGVPPMLDPRQQR